jgi:hypothetical protein
MTDRELLEAAARAAGIYYWIDADAVVTHSDTPGSTREWNPLTDDGDALRLAVKLRIAVDPWGAGACVVAFPGGDMAQIREPHYGDDPERATRRAIVRAAAEIGRR